MGEMSSSSFESTVIAFFKVKVKRVTITGIILSHEKRNEWCRGEGGACHIRLKPAGYNQRQRHQRTIRERRESYISGRIFSSG